MSFLVRRFFSVSPLFKGGLRWRLERGLPTHRNEYGPLTDLPDWSYTDGSPGKLGKGQIKRLVKNEELARRVLESISELDIAVECKVKNDANIETSHANHAEVKLREKCDNPPKDYQLKHKLKA